jgi:hypothetical protein
VFRHELISRTCTCFASGGRGGNYSMFASVYYNPAAPIARQFNLNARTLYERVRVFGMFDARVPPAWRSSFWLDQISLACRVSADFPRIFPPRWKMIAAQKMNSHSVGVTRAYLFITAKNIRTGSLCLFFVRRFFQFNVLKPDDLVCGCAYVYTYT